MRYFPFIALSLITFAALPACAAAAALTRKEAIAKVQHDTQGKVLSAETKLSGKQTIYRIKVLTHDGKVKIIEVPADDRRDVEAR